MAAVPTPAGATATAQRIIFVPLPVPSATATATKASAPEPAASTTPTALPATATVEEAVTASVLIEGSATPAPPPCWQEGGRIEPGQLATDLLRQPLDFRVYLPPCYELETSRRYPSLYLIHGQSFSDEQWDHLGVDETADALIAAGEVAPFIIVMPRDRVWTTPKEDRFGQALIEELIPWIDANYRTQPERGMRAIGGLSRGGGWSLHLGLKYWELFGAIGGHSLAIFKSDLPYYINLWLDAIPPDELPRLYMDIGDHDLSEIKRAAEEFEKLLTRRGIAHEWHVNVGYHDETYWGAHVEEYLRWYTEGW